MLQWLSEYSAIEDFGYSRILPLQITANEARKSSTLSILNSFGKTQSENPIIRRGEYERLFGFEDIQAAKVAHCNGAMAVSMTFPSLPLESGNVKPLKVSYSGDCRPSYHFSKIGTDTTVLIHEATFDDELQGDAKAKKHSTTSEALGIGAQMNAKAVVLTHFSQRYQKIPVLQTVTDGEEEDPLLDPKKVAEDVPMEDEDAEVDPTIENADNMDMHPTIASSTAPAPGPAKPMPSLTHETSSLLRENARVIKVRNKDMKVAIAFDYMRVKIGEICELEKFNDALNELLVKDEDVDSALEGTTKEANGNGKRISEDDGEGREGKGKKKQKKHKERSKRNN
jgi:ribonuclease Z